ncbi:hypothetical protein BG011_007293 [Mortierella polycephala]|uniref:Uncharacterized protein n=1 Tax=Mortierella polycephala TaxID=41804 RepID=A0A9P6PST9_9FUNG|nr:hypothetical protein BG011_007293 [Mortierella polycephala]
MSKVMLEEKFFETWFDGCTVLLGDGAVNAMQDAVVLANYISALKINDAEAILKLFRQYQDERAPHARAAVTTSANLPSLFGRFNTLFRKLILNIPMWLWLMALSKARKSRPWISFFPSANDAGSQKPHYQPSLARTRPKDH